MRDMLKQYGINPESFLDFQSGKVQLETVKQNGNSIRYIQNPSEKVQLEAVKQNGHYIRHIQNPSEKVQLEAVKQIGYSIQHISNPSEKVQRLFVKYILQQTGTENMNQYYLHKLSNNILEELLKQITIKNVIT